MAKTEEDKFWAAWARRLRMSCISDRTLYPAQPAPGDDAAPVERAA